MTSPPITPHAHSLRTPRLILRPLSEDDWEILTAWNNDPEVLYYTEGGDVHARSRADVQRLYRSVCARALCFVMEHERVPIGEAWLQQMNLERILERYPDLDLRRIDLAIGEKRLWGRGLGTEAIAALCALGFGEEGADAIFACDVADYNVRSLRAFRKLGFRVDGELPQPVGNKARMRYDLVLTRADYDALQS